MTTSTNVPAIYAFKIDLQRFEPPIWRRIEVPGNYTFFDLHVAIQDSFQWSDLHSHKFETVRPKRDVLTKLIMAEKYVLTKCIGVPDGTIDTNKNLLSEKETRIFDHFAMENKRKRCIYTYNFEFKWSHYILLESISAALPNVVYPRCTAGQRQSPPENCPPFRRESIIFRNPKVLWESEAHAINNF